MNRQNKPKQATLDDFVEGVIFKFNGRTLRISAEERQNHPVLKKAVLSERFLTREGEQWLTIDSWKPEHETSKRYGYYFMPSEIIDAFEACKNAIKTSERKLGIADY